MAGELGEGEWEGSESSSLAIHPLLMSCSGVSNSTAVAVVQEIIKLPL